MEILLVFVSNCHSCFGKEKAVGAVKACFNFGITEVLLSFYCIFVNWEIKISNILNFIIFSRCFIVYL